MRSGAGTKVGSHQVSENEEVKQEESVTRRITPIFDPYFLVISDAGSFLRGAVSPSYSPNMIALATLVSAKRDERGNIAGTWSFGEKSHALLDLTFSSKQGNRPIHVAWWQKSSKDKDAKSKGKAVTVSAIKWFSLPKMGGPKKPCWVPIEIARTDYFSDGFSQTDRAFRLEWKALPKRFSFPLPEAGDWREPFASLFDTDWSLSYDEYVAPYAKEVSASGR